MSINMSHADVISQTPAKTVNKITTEKISFCSALRGKQLF